VTSDLMSDSNLSRDLVPDATVALLGRGVLAVSGEDRIGFLQGLVSNDVTLLAEEADRPARALWAAFLTPQGKYLHDFIMLDDGNRILLDLEADRLDDLNQRLRRFRLRSKVALDDVTSEFTVLAVPHPSAAATVGLPHSAGALIRFQGGFALVEPRHADLGLRLLLPASSAPSALASFDLWDRQRLLLGIPDGSRDLQIEKSTLLECGFDELNGVSWDKGCYMGQELTARTKYRGLVKKRLVPVDLDGPLPAPGEPVLQNGDSVGEIRSGCGDRALALLRLDSMSSSAALMAGTTVIQPRKPAWARF
jgi:folate-binding protein YgfZ